MGLFSAILGNASEVDASKLEKEFSDLLIDGESIQHAYKLFRDLIVFTNFHLFLVDKQGMTGKKREYTCVPYKAIDYFSKETAGHFDLDAEIKIWIKSRKEPIVLEFRKDAHIHDVFKVLMLKRSGSPTYFVMPHFNEERPDIDFGTSDFPELLWVRSANSSGVMEVNGIKCYVFSKESKGVVQETAFIAMETKLPVRRTLGGMVFDYQYSNKPEAIQYPPELLAEVEVFFQHQTKTHRPISKP